MTETLLVRSITKFLRERGFYVIKISDRFRSGIPDLYCVKDGVSYWFEVKCPAGKVSKLQEYEIEQLQQHGAHAAVVRSMSDVAMQIVGNEMEGKHEGR
jgi:Holliday junction resolvase